MTKSANMGHFVGSFKYNAIRLPRRILGIPAKQAMFFEARTILDVHKGVIMNPNEGPKWWMDAGAARYTPVGAEMKSQGHYKDKLQNARGALRKRSSSPTAPWHAKGGKKSNE